MDRTKPSSSARQDAVEGFSPAKQSERPGRRTLVPHGAVLPAALIVGVTGDLLVRSPNEPALVFFLFFLALGLAVLVSGALAGLAPSREALAWVIGGIVLASGFVFRASPALQAFAFLSAAAAFAFPAFRAGRAWMWRSGVGDHVEAVFAAMAYAGLGVFRLAADGRSRGEPAPGEAADAGPRRARAILVGLLLATPLLFLFGALFMSADPVFEGLVTDLVGTAIEELASHVVVIGIFAWLAAGYLTGFLTGTRMRGLIEGRVRQPALGIVEVGIVLGLIDLLFAAFVAVQFRYLFGGADLVEVTPGLTYAEYAREGFAQLAFASALVLPTLLAADWLLRPRSPGDRTVFRILGGLQLLLLGVVILSAFQRVAVYQAAYGLTESRFYGVAFLVWLMLLSIGFAATVLRGRREHFACPALLSGLALVAALFIANPDAWIARTNLARADLSGVAVARENRAAPRPVDAAHLASLSADAVPVLLRGLPRLRPEARCDLAGRLLERWGGEPEPDWRSWNHSVSRARSAVQAEAAELRRLAERCKVERR